VIFYDGTPQNVYNILWMPLNRSTGIFHGWFNFTSNETRPKPATC